MLQLIFSGEYTKAMSKDWHSGHFCCWQCDESLTGQRYVLRDDHPYCIKCYENVFANTCDECHKIIGIDSKVSVVKLNTPFILFFIAILNFLQLIYHCLCLFLFFSRRICRTRRNIGMRPVSCATNAASLWWTSNSARKPKRSTAAIATIHNLHRAATDAAKFSVRVSFWLLFA